LGQDKGLIQKVAKSDEQVLLSEGYRMRQQIAANQLYVDKEFSQNKALANLGVRSIVGWSRVSELTDEQG
jgi:hypothetical protein